MQTQTILVAKTLPQHPGANSTHRHNYDHKDKHTSHHVEELRLNPTKKKTKLNNHVQVETDN